MDLLTEATRAEFAHSTTYLNTANCGVLPRSTVAAVRELAEAAGAGVPAGFGDFDRVNRSRAAFGRLVGVDAERVAVGSAVSTHVGLVAASLPPGAEVLCPEGDFASVINPFVVRGDLKVCFAPLESLAEAVGPDTALVSLSAVQSADGRLADLSAVRAATTAHGARMLVDATQAAGWLPFDASSYDYTVTMRLQMAARRPRCLVPDRVAGGPAHPDPAAHAAGWRPSPCGTPPMGRCRNWPTGQGGSTSPRPSSPTMRPKPHWL